MWREETPAFASGQVHTPVAFRWDRFTPKGDGISLYKPTSLQVRRGKAASLGYRTYRGTEPVTGTVLTLYVHHGARTATQVEQDLYALTKLQAQTWLKVLQRGPSQGFAWQQGLYHQTRAARTQSALLLGHAKRPIVYIVLVDVDLATATRHLRLFHQAYQGMRAVP